MAHQDLALTGVLLIAALCISVAYIVYWLEIMEGVTKANVWSWSMWSIAILAEAITYEAANNDWLKSGIFFLSAFCCIIVTIAAVTHHEPEKIDWQTIVSFGVALAALIWWHFSKNGLVAHIAVVLVIPLSFWPIMRGAVKKPENEHPLAWLLWWIGDLLTLLVILCRYEEIQNLPYILVEFGFHFMMWTLVAEKRQGA